MPHHSVYVIELSKVVLKNRRFSDANPQYDPIKPCVYVGMTGITPEERFQQYKNRYKASKYVKKYGVKLRLRLYEEYNPMGYEEAAGMERILAERLRKKGYTVWQK